MTENQNIEKKSLKVITSATTDWNELAKDCVGFANARGGVMLIGIEDNESVPPPDQRIDSTLSEKLRKRMSELTVNVSTITEILTDSNGGEYIRLTVHNSASTVAGTTDGRYYIRVSDECKPIMPDELFRLVTDKPAFIWETQVRKTVKKVDGDPVKLNNFYKEIQKSDRVSSFVKQKSTDELLDHYLMAEGEYLTNLGILWVGKRTDRAKLLYAPIVQFFKYNEHGDKVNKIIWDDFSLNPMELVEEIWTKIPDWKEGIEVSDGMFRKFIPNYEEEVIRELLINALAHRPYTTRGDIYINLYPNRLEIHNPGLFPLGVTPENVLHKSIRRNEHLSKVLYDLKLMDREGSGYDKMYEVLLSNGKQIPIPHEGDDRVWITIENKILKPEIIRLVQLADEMYHLKQREKICLGLIAQHTTLTAIEFSSILNFNNQPNAIRDWLGRLPELGLVKSKGKTKGVEYFIDTDFLKESKFKGKTNLKKIEVHRLRELLVQDLLVYPSSLITEIQERIGNEISIKKIRTVLNSMVSDSIVNHDNGRKFRRYSLSSKKV